MLTGVISLASCQVDVFDSFSPVQMVVKSVIILIIIVDERETVDARRFPEFRSNYIF